MDRTMDEINNADPSSKPDEGGSAEANEQDVNKQPSRQDIQNACCKTCDSTQDCREDADNPGDFYCMCCWEEYAVHSQQMQGQPVKEPKVWADNMNKNHCKDISSGASSEQISNGVNNNVQSIATQSPPEWDIPQTQALSMTQPQTQAMTQPRESQPQESFVEFDVDEHLENVQSSQKLDEPRKDDANVESEPAVRQTGGDAKVSKPHSTAYKDDNVEDFDRVQNASSTHVDNDAAVSESSADKKIVQENVRGENKLPDSGDAPYKAEGVDAPDEKASTEEEDIAPVVRKASDEEAKSQITVRHDNLSKTSFDDKESCEDGQAEEASPVDKSATDEEEKQLAKTGPEVVDMRTMFESNDCDSDEDHDASFMSQDDVNVSSKMTGLLTQAGTFSDDERDKSDDDDGMDLEYEGKKVNAEPAPRPPTIDTSEQLPMSGLTAPSQHLSMPRKSQNLSTSAASEDDVWGQSQSNNGENLNGPEAAAAGVVATDDQIEVDATQDDGPTEDTCGSLYGAETQLLPSVPPETSHDLDGNISNKQGQVETSSTAEDLSGLSEKQNEQKTDECRGMETLGTTEKYDVGRVNLRITPQKGVLSTISYPHDHEEINDTTDAQCAIVKTKSIDKARENSTSDDDETQQSQDLLETSSGLKKREEDSFVREKVAHSTEHNNVGKSTTSQFQQHPETSKSTRVDSTAWLSNNRGDASSPRFVLPATKQNSSKKAQPEADSDSLNADESDDESIFNSNAHPLENDPIEDTQNEDTHIHKRTSSLKRLSRGAAKEDSTSKSVSLPLTSTLGKNQFNKRSNIGLTSSITPKVLHYSKPKADSESEAEFEDGIESDKDTEHRKAPFDQSQSEYRALKQLEVFEEFTKQLPSADEIGDLKSRQELKNQIDQLHQSYGKQIDNLKIKISKLEQKVRQKDSVIKQNNDTINEMKLTHDDAIREKEDVIKKKASVIEKQEAAIASLMDRFKGISPPGSVARRNNYERDLAGDNSEDDSQVLSALKRPATTSRGKRKVIASPTIQSICNAKDSASTTNKSKRSARKVSSVSRSFSPEIWKDLEEKGWKYRTGPEPYNMVYVPPDGSTHNGTKLGIHFFNGDQVVDAAIARGHIPGKSDSSLAQSHNKSGNAAEAHSENEWDGEVENGGDLPDEPLDDSKLVGEFELITLESGRVVIELVASFTKENQDSVSFQAALWNPVWQRLKAQGGMLKLNWRYERCSGIDMITRTWCYVPPSSDLGSKGKKGVDFFLKEEDVMLKVLEEAKRARNLSPWTLRNTLSITSIITVLTRAVQEEMDYDDVRTGKSPKTRSRKPTALLLDAAANERAQSSSKTRATASPKPSRTPSTTRKRKTPSTSFSKQSTAKKKKTTPNVSPSFHTSQTQRMEVAAPSFNRTSPKNSAGPLSKFSFFTSGVDASKRLEARIKKLGGRVITPGANTAKESHSRLFFLSEYNSWRKPKYIFAAALGVPMLHYEWLSDLETQVKNSENAKAMSSDLYQRHRLPVGLDNSTGVFLLQRASHARDWLRPGYSKYDQGELIFDGMTIAIAVRSGTEWQLALTALGATVICMDDLKGKGQLNDIDCCLLSASSLPPQVTSAPTEVSEMLRHIPDDKPRLDLAWAHQSIIQRRRLPLCGDPRYEALPCGAGSTFNRLKVYSIKSGKKDARRYEVGDLVTFNDRKTRSFGRILGITWNKSKECVLEIQVLDNTGPFELTDCPSSPIVCIDESALLGNIVMLGSNMHNLGYLPDDPESSDIFRQIKQVHESQM